MKRAFRGLVVLAALCVFGMVAGVRAGGEMSPEEAARLIREFEAGAPAGDLNRVLTAYSRTLKRLNPVYNKAKFDTLWTRLLDYRDDPRFGKDERYHLGWILARHEPDTGYPYLMAVAAEHRDSPEAPKIVFTVGNRLREAGDWDGAIVAYETYIDTFPEQTFFVNKAYQHVIDAHLAKGETELAADMQRDVADLINDTGDAVAQMNLARQFDRQGADALARSTWALGRDRAMRQFEAAEGQEKDRLAIEIARYAFHFRDKETAKYIWSYARTRREGNKLSVLAMTAKYLGTLELEEGNIEKATEHYKMGRQFPGSEPERANHLIEVFEFGLAITRKVSGIRELATKIASDRNMVDEELNTLANQVKFKAINVPGFGDVSIARDGLVHSAIGLNTAKNLQTVSSRLGINDERRYVLQIALADVLVANGLKEEALEACNDLIAGKLSPQYEKYRQAALKRKDIILNNGAYFPDPGLRENPPS